MLNEWLTILVPKVTVGIEDCFDKENNSDFDGWTQVKTERQKQKRNGWPTLPYVQQCWQWQKRIIPALMLKEVEQKQRLLL